MISLPPRPDSDISPVDRVGSYDFTVRTPPFSCNGVMKCMADYITVGHIFLSGCEN